MNILITGIHGFVGSNLVAALNEKHTIFGLDIVSPQKNGVNRTYRWSELEQIPPVDVVIHLAGKAHDTKNTTEEKTYFDLYRYGICNSSKNCTVTSTLSALYQNFLWLIKLY